ncbi:DUF1003 domain-containing protein [Ekhidna sp.]|uniref:DUF1003 domain-containing protein n=1 Tax=Ekhidna sp. TaxID=2608089 RepID=UPI0032995FE1
MDSLKCFISGKKIPPNEAHQGLHIRKGVFQLIHKQYPAFSENDFVCTEELNKFRKAYLLKLVSGEKKELSKLEKEVLQALTDHTKVVTQHDLAPESTFGQRLADKIATFGGSWTFIIAFFSVLMGWIFLNVFIIAAKPFDPYPFILLNLILSCLAAVQAPVIMMSQNRQEQKDRSRAENDYKINLKAEVEIRTLHEKLDHLITYQNKRMMEVQQLQMEYLEDLVNKIRS